MDRQDSILFREEDMPQARPSSENVREFLRDDTGAVLLEYVVLLMGCFLTIHIAIQPLHNALLGFAADVFTHLSLP